MAGGYKMDENWLIYGQITGSTTTTEGDDYKMN